MKKLLALLLALMMLFSVATVFAGCEDSGKKKSSSSKRNDDEEDEDEDEDSKEDEDNDNEEDEDKEGEDDQNGDEGEDDVTEPMPTETEPTEPEPTEPEPTEVEEDELLDAPYESFDEEFNNFIIAAQILSGEEYKYFEIGIQNLSDEEGIIYYFDETGELIMHYQDGAMDMYVYQDDAFVLDTTTSDADKLAQYQSIAYILSMFVDFPSLLGDVQYQWLGEEDGYACYDVYANGALARTIYMDTETGLCMYILDQNGNDIMWVEELYVDVDFTEYIP